MQNWLIEHCGPTRAGLRRAGKDGVDKNVRHASGSAESTNDAGIERIIPSPQHIPIIVAGARNAAISMVVRVFGLWSGQASPVEMVE